MTENQTPDTNSTEADQEPYRELVASLAEFLDISSGLAHAVDVARYNAMRDHIAHLLDLDRGLEAALAASPVQRTRATEATEQSVRRGTNELLDDPKRRRTRILIGAGRSGKTAAVPSWATRTTNQRSSVLERVGPPDAARTGDTETGAARVPVDPAWLTATMAALVDTHQVPGAQLAVHRGGVTVTVELGELERGAGIPVTRETAFPIGPISKAWTATLAMILVADGDLELDAPLDENLPELDELVGRITVRQLLSHTSGFASSPDASELSTLSLRRYVREHCRRQDLILPPGTGFSYSSRNYVLVGHLIETVTGIGWWEAIKTILLRPLGVDPAIVVRAVSPGRPIATGHSVNTALGRTRPVRQSLAPVESPAGALAMSALDLVAMGLMHVGSGVPELLPAANAERMWQAAPGADPFGLADGWGCGLAVFRDGTTDWVGHDGNTNGTSCYLRIDPVGGWVVALTTNANTGSYLWEDLCTELRRADLPLGAHSPHLSSRAQVGTPAECVGSYSNGPAEYHVTAADEGDLYLAIGGELTARLSFYDDMDFVVQDLTSGLGVHVGRFLRDPITKQVEQLQIFGRIARRRRPPAVPEGETERVTRRRGLRIAP